MTPFLPLHKDQVLIDSAAPAKMAASRNTQIASRIRQGAV
jgi:hypothetical protein